MFYVFIHEEIIWDILWYEECIIKKKSHVRRIDATQLHLLGHVERLQNNRFVKSIYDEDVEASFKERRRL